MPVSTADINLFTCGFSSMIDAGQSIVRSLTALARQETNPELRQAIEQVNQELQAGSTLSRAMWKHPDVFSQDYVESIRQGEINGNLDIALQRLCYN